MRFRGVLWFCFSVSLLSIARAQQHAGPASAGPAAAGPIAGGPIAAGAVAAGPATFAAQAQAPAGLLTGTVTDADNALVQGARLILVDDTTKRERSAITAETGRFRFENLPAGTYTLKVAAAGLEARTQPATLRDGEVLELPPLVLRVASTNTDVEVRLTQEDLAEEDIRVEEKQRLGGFVPNFYVAYDWKAPPLTAKQKFKLAGRTIVDPATLIIVGGIAGIEQATNGFPGYGQGAPGYAKRYAAGFGDTSIGTLLGGAVLPVIFKQDPRYFYKGTGTRTRRALYALSTGVIARGDNGRWQPAYGAVIGDFASGAISNLYYPASNRSGATVTFENGFLGIAGNAVGNLIQEFVLRKITPGSRKDAAPAP